MLGEILGKSCVFGYLAVVLHTQCRLLGSRAAYPMPATWQLLGSRAAYPMPATWQLLGSRAAYPMPQVEVTPVEMLLSSRI